MPRAGSPYGYRFLKDRAALLAQGLPCALRLVCNGSLADSADHFPPLAQHEHVNGTNCCHLIPACKRCQKAQGARLGWHRDGIKRRSLPLPSRRW